MAEWFVSSHHNLKGRYVEAPFCVFRLLHCAPDWEQLLAADNEYACRAVN
jgi:hypothetical protein